MQSSRPFLSGGHQVPIMPIVIKCRGSQDCSKPAWHLMSIALWCRNRPRDVCKGTCSSFRLVYSSVHGWWTFLCCLSWKNNKSNLCSELVSEVLVHVNIKCLCIAKSSRCWERSPWVHICQISKIQVNLGSFGVHGTQRGYEQNESLGFVSYWYSKIR